MLDGDVVQITDQEMRDARDKHADNMFDEPCIDKVNYQVGFMDGVKWYREQLNR